MKHVLSRLTYANVTATLALFIALGGASAYASLHLGKGVVGTPQLKAGAVTLPKLSGSTKDDLASETGPTGPVGPPGPEGKEGALAEGASAAFVAQKSSIDISSGLTTLASLNLPAGEYVLYGTGAAYLTSGPSGEPGRYFDARVDCGIYKESTPLFAGEGDLLSAGREGELSESTAQLGGSKNLATQAIIGIKAPTTVSLQCLRLSDTGIVHFNEAALSAIKVASLEGQ